MKVQWQLVDVETKKAIPVGEVFEIVDFMKSPLGGEEPMSWPEAALLFGDPLAEPPAGIIDVSPIKQAIDALNRGPRDTPDCYEEEG